MGVPLTGAVAYKVVLLWVLTKKPRYDQKPDQGLKVGSPVIDRDFDIGETGFEPAASCSQSKRATKLRHSPK